MVSTAASVGRRSGGGVGGTATCCAAAGSRVPVARRA